ncbi:MAG: AAA family ATPase [Deltaproteobacteria bacterium]|jgi:hypothetical protein|nr:AAA family ATPase [Deltaproteobacteria bacterium]
MSGLIELQAGLAAFPAIRQEGCFYAGKTQLLRQLIKVPKPYFLSRPRRFGKSLTLNALEAILKGRRELFEGLWIDSHAEHIACMFIFCSFSEHPSFGHNKLRPGYIFPLISSIPASGSGVNVERQTTGFVSVNCPLC